MTPLGHDRYCDEVIEQARLLRGSVDGADLSATVPTCPDWSLAQLVRHVGGNLRAAEAAVRTGEAVLDPAGQVPGVAGPDGEHPAALDAWLAEAAAAFAATVRAADPGTQAQIWTFRQPTAFWARRAALDLVIHRADAALTVGAPYAVAPELAADAVDELLELFSDPELAGGSPRLAELRGPARSIHLHATTAAPELAAEWLIQLGPDGFTWRRGHERATVALRGPLADVLLVFYRRLPADAPGVEVLGEAALLDFWLERVSLI
ncbi:MAG TPA: maleylpyruvate isomerase family mycothiol-dependent enzyme [Actinomycetes bacterium]|nr:maleylpyruvate isomerase family mycothiol-dependent enzyme [Actinomycetes bacterium]